MLILPHFIWTTSFEYINNQLRRLSEIEMKHFIEHRWVNLNEQILSNVKKQ